MPRTARKPPEGRVPPNPSGICTCGCGQQTKRMGRNTDEYFAGEYRMFLPGHQTRAGYGYAAYWEGKPRPRGDQSSRWTGGRRRTESGYVLVSCAGHPRAANGYVREHILVAERALGRYLPDGVVVHHANGKRDDNRPENLVICHDTAYHMLIHRRMRAQKECGNANWLRCRVCKKYISPDDPELRRDTNGAYRHRTCNSDRKAAS